MREDLMSNRTTSMTSKTITCWHQLFFFSKCNCGKRQKKKELADLFHGYLRLRGSISKRKKEKNKGIKKEMNKRRKTSQRKQITPFGCVGRVSGWPHGLVLKKR
jgi:hypothetical protein